MSFKTITANAKINLFLHVLGKRDDSYHDLQSLMMFGNYGDQITIKPSDETTLYIDGPYASDLNQNGYDVSRGSDNIIVKALWAIRDHANKSEPFHIKLTKKIPLGAGLGGGSADAAVILRYLSEHWDIDTSTPDFQNIMFDLGADVPACFYNAPCFINGAGESPSSCAISFDIPCVMVHPNIHCSTNAIFDAYNRNYSEHIDIPKKFKNINALCNFLKRTDNDLTRAAFKNISSIKKITQALDDQDDLLFSRMSGSGSACFGLFKSTVSAQNAEKNIKKMHPDWWVHSCLLQKTVTD